MPSEETATTKPPSPPAAPIAANERGLVLKGLDDYWRFAGFIIRAGVAPKDMKSPEAIVVAMQLGAEVGLPPMAAIQNVMVINGRPSLFGDVQLGVIRSTRLFDDNAFREWFEGEGDDLTAYCRVRRIGGQPITQRFSVRQAKRAKLWNKIGPWTDYPERMLQWRARGWALRDGFSDALKGLSLSVEEARDFIDVEPMAESVMPEPKPGQSRSEALAEHLSKPEPQPTPERARHVAETVQAGTKALKQQGGSAGGPQESTAGSGEKPEREPASSTEAAPGPLAAKPAKHRTPTAISQEACTLFMKLPEAERKKLKAEWGFAIIGSCSQWDNATQNDLLIEIKERLAAHEAEKQAETATT